jgi:hypothetical protein
MLLIDPDAFMDIERENGTFISAKKDGGFPKRAWLISRR